MLSKSLTLKMRDSRVLLLASSLSREVTVNLLSKYQVNVPVRKVKPTFKVVKGRSSGGAGRGHPAFRADLKHRSHLTD